MEQRLIDADGRLDEIRPHGEWTFDEREISFATNVVNIRTTDTQQLIFVPNAVLI